MKKFKYLYLLLVLILSNCETTKQVSNNNQVIDNEKVENSNIVWKQIGPSVPNEDLLDKYSDATQRYWHGEGNVFAIWIDDSNDNHLLISLAFGGLFETFDTGENWKSLTDNVPVHNIGKIDVKDNVIFIATGFRFENPQRFSSNKYYGLGVIKSQDRGKTWLKPKTNFYCADFSLSKNHKTIYAISTSHVYKSSDNGNSYTKMADFFDENYKNKNFRFELKTVVVHPNNPNIAFVTGKGVNSKDSKVFYKTIDGGKTWTNETKKLLKFVREIPKQTTEQFIKDVALYFNEKTNKLWLHFSVALVYGENKSRKKKRYKLHSYILSSGDFTNFNYVTSQYFPGGTHYSPKIYEKDDILYLLGWYLKIKKPDDTKFINVGRGKVHQDCRDVKTDSKGIIYYGNDAGIVKSNNLGKSWTNAYKNLNANLIFEMSYYSDSNNRILDLGTQDDGYYRNIMNEKTPKYPIATHEGGIYTSPHNKDRIYIKDNFVSVSNDGGKKFKKLKFNDGKSVIVLHRDGLLREDPLEENILFVGHNDELYISNNFGEKGSWTNITPKENGRGADMAIPKSNTKILYYANHLTTYPIKNGGFKTYKTQGHILKSIDKGKTWINIFKEYDNILKYSVISDVEIDNNNPNKVWFSVRNLTEGEKVFYSDDGGKKWKNISFNLPNVPVNRIEYDEKSKTLFLANDYGVYYLNNNTWIEYGKGLPKVIVNGLVIDNIYNEIIISTFGRGAWRATLK